MDIYENTIIYILTPSRLVTGGPNSCHQLCHKLRNLNFNAFIIYYELGLKTDSLETPAEYLEYNNPIAKKIKDEPQNIIIMPETVATLYFLFPKSRKAIWWLSVDFYYSSIFNSLKNNQSVNVFDLFSPKECWHFTDCEYAKNHLELFSIPKNRIFPLNSYLHPSYVRNALSIQGIEKQDFVTYNPKKGLQFTLKIIDYCQSHGYEDIKFIPLTGFTQRKLSLIYKLSKIHIDFGTFPGREYIPREAAINDCCVITGLLGASKYYEDVPIPDNYKFENTLENLPRIAECIKNCLVNYDSRVKDFVSYKQFALNLENVFESQILDAFQRV